MDNNKSFTCATITRGEIVSIINSCLIDNDQEQLTVAEEELLTDAACMKFAAEYGLGVQDEEDEDYVVVTTLDFIGVKRQFENDE